MSNPQQVDMNQTATITMPLHQWNGVLMCLRTGNGQAFTWEFINPLVTAISQQLQTQMYPRAQVGQLNPEKANGEAHEPAEAGNAPQGLRAAGQRDWQGR